MSTDSASIPYLGRLRRLLGKIHSVVFVVPEDTDLVRLEDDLVAMVSNLVGRTLDLLQRIGRHYEAVANEEGMVTASPSDGDDVLKAVGLMEIGALISAELAVREIADLAFMARAQLLEIHDALGAALRERQIWAVASHADTGLRRAGKALVAMESAICEFEGLGTPDREWVELELSLKIRRLYGRFRRGIEALGQDTSLELGVRLEGAAVRIATLRQLEIYPFMRIDDRLTIRSLQKRIAACLRHGTGAQDAAHLWQDAVSFGALLASVNARSELREHDFETVRGCCYRLQDTKPSPTGAQASVPADALQALDVLEGLDDELDDWIEAPAGRSASTLLAIMQRLHKQLKPAKAGSREVFAST